MQSPFLSTSRSGLLALCVAFVATIGLMAPVGAGARGAPVAARIKQCRHRFAGKGKKKHQAELRCIKQARSKRQPTPVTPTEAPAAAPVSPGASSSSPAPAPGGDATPPTTPATPTGPAAPEKPAPLEMEVPAGTVVTGSSLTRNLPNGLTSLSAIESTTGAEPGVTVALVEGRLVISAATEAAPVLLHLVIAGTGCTAKECGRQVLIRIRLTVQPAVVPSVEVDPNGPTSGPAGFGPQVITPSCSFLRYGFDNGASTSGVGVASPKETFNVYTPSTLPVGSHQVWFECLGSRGGGAVWTAPGFEITVTGPSIPIGLQSSTVPPGGELVFTTGPNLGASPCPTLAGVSVGELILELNTAQGTILVARHVPMPDGLTTEGLLLPSSAPAGEYSASERCFYSNVGGERASYEFTAARENVTVD